jgi:hypothetical protein
MTLWNVRLEIKTELKKCGSMVWQMHVEWETRNNSELVNNVYGRDEIKRKWWGHYEVMVTFVTAFGTAISCELRKLVEFRFKNLAQSGTRFRRHGSPGKPNASKMHVHARWSHIHCCKAMAGGSSLKLWKSAEFCSKTFGSIWNKVQVPCVTWEIRGLQNACSCSVITYPLLWTLGRSARL